MAKYRVKDSVGEIRHGVGKDVRTYCAGELIDLSADDAKALGPLLDKAKDEEK